MEEIKVGEYIRTKTGYIAKVKRFDEDNNLYCDRVVSRMGGENFRWLNKLEQKEDVKNHSPNIIDLIEVGDYVNGYKIFRMDVIGNEKVFKIHEEGSTIYLRTWKNEDIKSIVTHQQFNSIKYEVE